MASRTVCLLDRSTRRRATVTISAPDAAIASRGSSMDAYLPVPAMIRDRNVRPPRVQVSLSEDISASSDEGDDLDAVAFGENGGSMQGARHDLAVALDRDGLSSEAELADEGGDRGPLVHPPLLAID